MTKHEYKYKELKDWIENNSNQAFSAEEIEKLNQLVKRLAE